MKSTSDEHKKWGGLAQSKKPNKTKPLHEPNVPTEPRAVSQESFQHHSRCQVTDNLISNMQQNLQNGCRYKAELCNNSSKSQQKPEGRNPKKDNSCLNTFRQIGEVV